MLRTGRLPPPGATAEAASRGPCHRPKPCRRSCGFFGFFNGARTARPFGGSVTAPRDRAQALFQRAVHASTPPEEARTSAELFVKLIAREQLWPPGGGGTARGSESFPGELIALRRMLDESHLLVDRQRGEITKLRRQVLDLIEERDSKPWTAPPKSGPAQPHPARDPRSAPRDIVSRYAGRCAVCGEEYGVGDRISWRRGHGASHVHCKDRQEAAE